MTRVFDHGEVLFLAENDPSRRILALLADQPVLGVIIAHEDDKRIRRALTMTPNISFYRYQVSFKLVKA